MEIKTEFAIDQRVWFMHENKIESEQVTRVRVEKGRFNDHVEHYALSGLAGKLHQDLIFASKESLLKSL